MRGDRGRLMNGSVERLLWLAVGSILSCQPHAQADTSAGRVDGLNEIHKQAHTVPSLSIDYNDIELHLSGDGDVAAARPYLKTVHEDRLLESNRKLASLRGRATEEAEEDTAGARLGIDIHDVGDPITNRCSDMNMEILEAGRICGSPLSEPCFDYSRCRPPPDGPGVTFYVYDNECTLQDSSELAMEREVSDLHNLSPIWRNAANELGVLAETYENACMFIHVNNGFRTQSCSPRAPLWNGGANHFMVDFTDEARDTRPDVASSFAMEGASNSRTCFYRSDYDMSLPLSPKHLFTQFQHVRPTERMFFLTVKGSVYLGGHGSEERLALAPLNDEAEGIVVAVTCFEKHDEHLLPENVEFCEQLKKRSVDYDYEELMETTFALVPSGRSPGTYRLGEVMSAGAIPVFVARDFVRPFREQIDWPSFSFVFTPDQARETMVETLKAVPPEKLEEMQRLSIEAFHNIFGSAEGGNGSQGYNGISRLMFRELQRRVEYHR